MNSLDTSPKFQRHETHPKLSPGYSTRHSPFVLPKRRHPETLWDYVVVFQITMNFVNDMKHKRGK